MVSSLKTAQNKKIKQTYSQNPMIKGEFPSYENNLGELSILNLNRVLGASLFIAILVSMVSYFLVVAQENSIITVHKDTNELNMENIELQNKVEQAKSYYNINYKVSKVNFLKKPDKIMEVNAIASVPEKKKAIERLEVKPVSGF
ncbi:MAG: hypothetical protein WCK67_03190 [bacterium]